MLTRRDSRYWKCRLYLLGLFLVSWRKVDFGILSVSFSEDTPIIVSHRVSSYRMYYILRVQSVLR